MCEGIKVVERVHESLDGGYELEFMLVDTCEEHGSLRAGFGALFAPDGSPVIPYEPVEFSADEDGRLQFLNTVSMVGAEIGAMLPLLGI